MNEERIQRFAERLEAWSFDEVRHMGVEANVAQFWNQFWDLHNGSFPLVEVKKRRTDGEKPWLDDGEFMALVEEKGWLYSRKVKGLLGDGEGRRLGEVSRVVNRMRRRLKREYFDRRLGEIEGDLSP